MGPFPRVRPVDLPRRGKMYDIRDTKSIVRGVTLQHVLTATHQAFGFVPDPNDEEFVFALTDDNGNLVGGGQLFMPVVRGGGNPNRPNYDVDLIVATPGLPELSNELDEDLSQIQLVDDNAPGKRIRFTKRTPRSRPPNPNNTSVDPNNVPPRPRGGG